MKKPNNVTIIMRGLSDLPDTEKQANEYFQKEGFGKLKKLLVIKTKGGKGGPGGRTDIAFKLTSPNIMKFGLSPFRFSSGTSWGQDYIDNDASIVPTEDLEKLKKIIRKYGG